MADGLRRTILGAAGAVLGAALLFFLVAPSPGNALPRLRAEPDVERGGRVIDSTGREVLLRGVNVNSLGQYWKGTDKDSVLPFDRRDPVRISRMGWNVVRLIVSWSRVEPEPGEYNEAYLDRVSRWVDRLEKNGVYTIIDFHQDAWGPTLAARPGESCTPPEQPGFGWDGAPGWATIDEGKPRCFNGAREVNPAVIAAWKNFFADTPAADGVGIQTHYVRMLKHIAKRFAKSKAVAGIDIMNEPGALGASANDALGPFYTRAVEAIRAGEKSGRGFRHMVLFEPSVLWSLLGSGAPPPFEADDQIVYSPHLYGGSIGGEGSPSRASFETARAEAKTFGGAPVLTGEWGGSPGRATGADEDYFNTHQALQDEFRIGATVWTWKQSCGDPHAATHDPDTAPPLPPWSLFKMDCTGDRNRIVGPYGYLKKDLRRAYVRRAPGRLTSTSYRQAGRVLEVSGTRSKSGSPYVEVFYPQGESIAMKISNPMPGQPVRRKALGPSSNHGTIVAIPVRPGDWTIRLRPSFIK
ncbi:MAG: glycoside hydrolase family 5 protein [Solirubrobacterales bacterium]